MAVRPLGSATIAFGLVSIPVKLFSAAESAAAVRFNQIDRRDGSRVKQQLVSSKSGETVPKDDIVKGFEFAKGQYVLFTKDELKALEAATSHTIDIDEFLPADAVDRIYFDKAYYLGPDKGAARAYQLLSTALRTTKRIAIGRYAARGRQHLVMMRPVDNGLLLEQLHYADEVRSFSEIGVAEVEIKEAELELAKLLIEQRVSEKFDPQAYRDEVRDQVMALIQRKVDGEDISVAPKEKPDHKIVDIMEALRASLATPDARKPARRASASDQGAPATKAPVGKTSSEKTSVAKQIQAKKPARKKRASA